MRRVPNSIFFKFLISSTLAIIITAISVGIISYYSYSSRYRTEIKNKNKIIIGNISDLMEKKIFMNIENIRLTCLAGQMEPQFYYFFKFFNSEINADAFTGYEVYLYLKELAAQNGEIIDGISVYYVMENILISSSKGINYLDRDMNSKIIDTGWIKDIFIRFNKYHVKNRDKFKAMDVHEDRVTFYFSYSNKNNEVAPMGFIKIDIKKRAFYDIIKGYSSNDLTIVADKEGKVVTFENSTDIPVNVDKIVKDIKIPENGASFTLKMKDFEYVECVVLYDVMNYNDYRIIRLVPDNIFFKHWRIITRNILILCLILTTAVCVYLFAAFSRIYYPLKMVIRKLKGTSGNMKSFDNECSIINNSFEQLTAKVEDLQSVLEANHPILENHFVFNIINRSIATEEQVNQHIKILNFKLEFNGLTAIYMDIHPEDKKRMSGRVKHFIRIDIGNYIKALGDFNMFYMSTILSDYDMAIVYGAKEKNIIGLDRSLEQVCTHFMKKYRVRVLFSIGDRVSDWLELYKSYEMARHTIKYEYFFPEISVFKHDDFKGRKKNSDKKIASMLDKFEKSLKGTHEQKGLQLISNIMDTLRSGSFTADYCYKVRDEINGIFIKYLEDVEVSMSKITGVSDEPDMDIFAFEKNIICKIKKAFHLINEKKENQAQDIIFKVKKYIRQNPGEDLSLNNVAQKVYLSSFYLSKLFKRETGKNFTEYVTEQRMNYARKLLMETDIKINDIAEKAGYSNTSYFIKVFKETYGFPPGALQKNMPGTGLDAE